MRLLSLAVVAGLFAAGVALADDTKPVDKKSTEKKENKLTGVLLKVEDTKFSIAVGESDVEKIVVFTTNDKTKFLTEEMDGKKDGQKQPDGKKEEPKGSGKQTEMKLTDLKVNSKLKVTFTQDNLATEVVQYSKPEEKKADDKKADDKKPEVKKADDK
jgi:outer membrane protein assembly factor BamE (lipoprotein component of BamABCDE complex)